VAGAIALTVTIPNARMMVLTILMQGEATMSLKPTSIDIDVSGFGTSDTSLDLISFVVQLLLGITTLLLDSNVVKII
jgi:hypothetical protein